MTDKIAPPSLFDRMLAELDGLPNVLSTRPSTLRDVPTFGVGGSTLHIVQTFRTETGDTIFLEHVSETGAVRLMLPPAVADTIARQRDALTAKSRSKAARATAAARAERGEQPAFLKGKRR